MQEPATRRLPSLTLSLSLSPSYPLSHPWPVPVSRRVLPREPRGGLRLYPPKGELLRRRASRYPPVAPVPAAATAAADLLEHLGDTAPPAPGAAASHGHGPSAAAG